MKDNKFSTFMSRKANEDELEAKIEQYTAQRSAEEIEAAMRAEGVPASVVKNGQDLMEKDDQLKYRNTFIEKNHPEMGSCILQQPPFRFSETEPALERPPCLGEHTEHICTSVVGMSDEEFEKLRADGVFG